MLVGQNSTSEDASVDNSRHFFICNSSSSSFRMSHRCSDQQEAAEQHETAAMCLHQRWWRWWWSHSLEKWDTRWTNIQSRDGCKRENTHSGRKKMVWIKALTQLDCGQCVCVWIMLWKLAGVIHYTHTHCSLWRCQDRWIMR